MHFRHGLWESRGVFDDAATLRVHLVCDGRSLSRTETLHELARSADARAVLIEALRAAPFAAYFWETPPTLDDDRPFECVVIDAPSLRGAQANPNAFADRFLEPSRSIASFENLGGDAELIVPRPLDSWDGAHLAAFIRSAPDELVHDLFRAVAESAVRRLGTRGGPIWVSTAGLGVSWLHVRLDARPKYYAHGPYRDATA